jgi:DNA polymerase III epsilon subunit family exonuclease
MRSLEIRHLRDEAFDFLRQADQPLPTNRIARHLFGASRHEQPEAQVVVHALLAADSRFVETHDHLWSALGAAHLEIDLDRLRYAVVDLETTGSIIGVDEIIEVGAVLLERGKVKRRFSTLVRAERSVPPWVARLTGLRDADLSDAPTFADVAPALRSLLADAVFVAHDIRFDLPFLRWEFARCGLPMPCRVGLCTLCLSREFWPELPSRSLAGLAEHFEITHAHPHRAAADADATAAVLIRALGHARQLGLRSLGDLYRPNGNGQHHRGHSARELAAGASD